MPNKNYYHLQFIVALFMLSQNEPDSVSEHSCSSASVISAVVTGCVTLVAGLITGYLTIYCVFKKKTFSTHHHQPEQEQVDESSTEQCMKRLLVPPKRSLKWERMKPMDML